MKPTFSQATMRRGFGGLSGLQSLRTSIPPTKAVSATPCAQAQSLCSRRHISDATASPTPEIQSTKRDALPGNKNKAPGTKRLSQTSPASSISEHVRLLMRQVPYPVAIITATDPSGPPDTTSFRGMTVSSFNTVTLTPHPVISFNVRRPSETLNALLASGRFLVHLLAPGPITATLARDFSKGNITLASMLSGHGDFEFGALDVCPESQGSSAGDGPLPILRRKQKDSTLSHEDADFPFVLECMLHPQKIDVHDHSIVLGTVVRAIEGSNATAAEQGCTGRSPDEQSADELCLTYANTRFWKMGNQI